MGKSLVVQWLGLHTVTAEGLGSITGWGTNISQALWHGKKKKINRVNWCQNEVKSLSRVQLFATPCTVAYKAPLSMEFSRQENWSELPFPSPSPRITHG